MDEYKLKNYKINKGYKEPKEIGFCGCCGRKIELDNQHFLQLTESGFIKGKDTKTHSLITMTLHCDYFGTNTTFQYFATSDAEPFMKSIALYNNK